MAKTNRDGVWKHDSGDIKADPEKAPGINQLPDGNIAMSKKFIEDAYEAIHESDEEQDHDD